MLRASSNKKGLQRDLDLLFNQMLIDKINHIVHSEELTRSHIIACELLERDHMHRQRLAERLPLEAQAAVANANQKAQVTRSKELELLAKVVTTNGKENENTSVLQRGAITEEKARLDERPEWGKRPKPLSPIERRLLNSRSESSSTEESQSKLQVHSLTPASLRASERRERLEKSPLEVVKPPNHIHQPHRTDAWSRPWSEPSPYSKSAAATDIAKHNGPYNQVTESPIVAQRLEGRARLLLEHEEEACFGQLIHELKAAQYVDKRMAHKIDEQRQLVQQKALEKTRVESKRQLWLENKKAMSEDLQALNKQRILANDEKRKLRRQLAELEIVVATERSSMETDLRNCMRAQKEKEVHLEATLRRKDIETFKSALIAQTSIGECSIVSPCGPLGSQRMGSISSTEVRVSAHPMTLTSKNHSECHHTDLEGRPPLSPVNELRNNSKQKTGRKHSPTVLLQRPLTATAKELHPLRTVCSHIQVDYSTLVYPRGPQSAIRAAHKTGNPTVIESVHRLVLLQEMSRQRDQQRRLPFLETHRKNTNRILAVDPHVPM